jgi:hypothetical protein
MTFGYLVLRVSRQRNGRDVADLFSARYPLGEPTFVDVRKHALRHGYDVAPVIGRYRTVEVHKHWHREVIGNQEE